ncbi:Imm8 family immunity protein [Aeromicrobium choanae]|uniref:Immunity protein 8 n=1 Tax=Aeromicrobium choanae TaxID=1736691 RepID=A0A1T4Z7V1_9ACTN|nr:Imm8 family immunity protein [Aeromicrobium choanae]SKB10102.1 Immunity protein 8 [Aeromicrobium choanae]
MLNPTPQTFPADPAGFALNARVIVGPSDAEGEESFDVHVCTPEWLATACDRAGGMYSARHHLVVNFDDFDQRKIRDWLVARIQAVEAETWSELCERIGRLGYWEFEDYPS